MQFTLRLLDPVDVGACERAVSEPVFEELLVQTLTDAQNVEGSLGGDDPPGTRSPWIGAVIDQVTE